MTTEEEDSEDITIRSIGSISESNSCTSEYVSEEEEQKMND